MTLVRRLATAGFGIALGAAAARVAFEALTRRPPREEKVWVRHNHRGEPVTLLEGPAYVAAAAGAVALAPGVPARLRAAGVAAALGAGAFGVYDDLAGSGDRRGFKGHLGALAHGEVTSGAVKILGIGTTGLLAGSLLRDKLVDKVLAGVVIAGAANVVNLFDLRPGRAIKAGLIAGTPGLLRGGPAAGISAPALGAAAALLPEDLRERAMLGDAGANALGALLGLAAAARASRAGLLARAAGLIGLMAASEKVSFTKVIADTPVLNAIDWLGRRPA
ncbi:hypothetical protein C3Y87_17590 [Carbonactinospora thermoautotrophica]|uniref:hypothetical protein n=1 Tax=Carbonactinospora thermoautotrophica TaxID=1469144 RepID=UPI00226FB85D|nr:hypothetical protein [Carbonactinospora thermoautotrophica]MCX9193182.1 hypothetical protein [Carbonactinospora thermoautotrophica]